MKTTFIIDAVNSNVIIPEKLAENQKIVIINSKEIIITELKENPPNDRKFGGAFRKLALKGDKWINFVSSSLDESELKNIVTTYFNIDSESLFRFF